MFFQYVYAANTGEATDRQLSVRTIAIAGRLETNTERIGPLLGKVRRGVARSAEQGCAWGGQRMGHPEKRCSSKWPGLYHPGEGSRKRSAGPLPHPATRLLVSLTRDAGTTIATGRP